MLSGEYRMVALVAGSGLGLERSSAFVLGSRGVVGQAGLGRASDNVYVNAATGNLVVQNADEMLIGLGPDSAIARTYNSQGGFTDDNGDNWRTSVHRLVGGLTGTVNTAGSTVTRTDWDGSESVYAYDTTRGLYVSTAGAGAYDTLSFSGSTWTWTDGNSRVVETYDANNGGRIVSSADTDGAALAFTYANGLISRVTTASGEYTDLVYTGTQLTQLTTGYTDGGVSKTLTRTRYGYDSDGRLSTVTVDLSPEDGVIADGKTYTTTYGYDGTSKRIAWISQSDGSRLDVTYTLVGGEHRVAGLSQTAASGDLRATSFAYDTVNRVTTVTDHYGQKVKLTYDTAGRLTRSAVETAAGATVKASDFTYDADGDLTSVSDGAGDLVAFEYDANGNLTLERDQAGNTVTRTYGTANQLLTETRYLVADPDGAGAGQPSDPVTTRFVYDTESHLRFVVGAEGRVTEFRYDAEGRQTASIAYTAATYSTAGLGATASVALSTMETWAAGLVDKSAVQRTDTAYDFRGSVASVARFEKALSTGEGDTAGVVDKRLYTYDQAGRLLGWKHDGQTAAETMVYDGLGRVVAATDFNGQTTTVQFNDAATTTVVSLSSGLTKTSVYNKAGELISHAEAASGVTTATTQYQYDKLGRLRAEIDPSGLKRRAIYDAAGRKVGDVDADGSLSEYVYDAFGRLSRTVRYKTALGSSQLSSLDDLTANPSIDTLRPAGDASDIWEWRVYDAAHRLVQTIDAKGSVTAFAYDGASRLTATTAYATRLTPTAVAGLKTTAPASPVSVTAVASDRTTRVFYDGEGRQIGALDAEGFLTRIVYDAAGRQVQTVGYATATTAGLRAAGTFAQLLTSVGTTVGDVHSWRVYDGRGLLRGVVNGEGDVVRYNYSARGDVDQTIRGHRISTATLASFIAGTRPGLTDLAAASAAGPSETTAFTHNLCGQVLTETKALNGGATEVTTYTYDNQRRLIGRTAASGTGAARTLTYRYDARGRLTGELGGEGSVALAAAAPGSSAAVYVAWGTTYVYDEADRLISKTEAEGSGGTGNRTLYFYDEDGDLRFEVNALGETIEHRYDAFGRRTEVLAYTARLASGTIAGWTGGLVTTALTTAVGAVANAQTDSSNQVQYDVDGTVLQSTDALGVTTSFGYNAFRELTATVSQLGKLTDPAGSSTVQTDRVYDRRGLLLSSTRDASGLNISTAAAYDAFGRAVQTTDANGAVRSTGYDRAGRTVTSTDALGQATAFTYDARGQVTTVTDRTGKVTTYAYTAFDRTVTVTTPEGLVATTVSDAHGQTVSLTNGGGRTVSYAYDKDGALKTVTDAAGAQATNAYDKAGRLIETIDARGSKTTYSYDAANRVLTRKADDGGLNLVTTYAYDGQGRQVSVTDPSGAVTKIGYDRAGRTTTYTVDFGRLNLTTEYAYDKAGRTLSVTEAKGTSAERTTEHVYDKADRLTKTIVDPGAGKLNLTTEYVYDKAGAVVAAKDALGNLTRFVNDAEGRRIWSVDALGGVTKTVYDAEGRVIETRAYATPIAAATLASMAQAATAAAVTAALTTSANDQVARYVYDGDGRLRFTVDALSRPTEYVYDGSGNVLRRIEYGLAMGAPTAWTLAAVQSRIAADNLAADAGTRTTRAVFDAAGRQAFAVDAAGAVTAYGYDAAGNVTKQTRYAALYTPSGDPTVAAMQTWASANAGHADNRVSRALYDGAGRAVYAVDAERYVTETQYDALGNVTKQIRYADRYTVADTDTATIVKAMLPSSPPASAAATSLAYDTAGRLTDTYDPTGVRTRMVLDALGQVVESAVAYGTTDASTTVRTYDRAGRVTAETRAYGTAEAATAEYGYDALGRMLSEKDGRGFTTLREYDALGRTTKVTVPLDATSGAVTTNVYDAFGNLVKVTDPRGNVGWFYYDALNRLTLQVDPEGYATETTYTIGGEAASVTRRAAKTTGTPSASTRPTVVTGAGDATTTITRDRLDRVVSVTDAMGFVESYGLNAFGDRVTVANKLGGVTTNLFDKRGLLLSETTAIQLKRADNTVEWSGSVVNTFEYDARGNRTKSVEASGAAEQRTTTFVWDKADRMTAKTGDAVQVVAQDLLTTSTVTPTETIAYDARGNAIETVDATGARTLAWYDDLNRKIADLGPTGTLGVYAYDANGNVVSEKVYATAVAHPASAGGTPPAASGAVRETTHTYDRNNRRVSSTTANLRVGELVNGVYQTSVASATTTTAYDAAGNATAQTDGEGNTTFSFYDKLGRRIAQVDAEGYLTSWTLDAEGNVLVEERFAQKPASSNGIEIGDDPAVLRSGVLSDPAKRVTTFTYDRNGRRLTETRSGLAAHQLSSQGVLSAGATSATIAYAYNGLGQVTSKTEANGDATAYAYDTAGRLRHETTSAFTDHAGASVQRRTSHGYDGLNNLTQTSVGAVGAQTADQRITTYVYGAGGRLASSTDATGFTRGFGYDAAGRVVKESWSRLKSDGTTLTEATAYRYDAAGRATFQANAAWNGTAWVLGDQHQVRYDAFGQVTGKGVNGLWQETFDYDLGGRMWRSTGGDGTTRLYVHDKAGNATLTLASTGADLSTYSTIDAALSHLTTGGANAVGAVAKTGIAITFTSYDKRGMALSTTEPFREFSTTAPATAASGTIVRSRAYNAFGEVVQETDARGGVTDFTYDAMGRLIKKQSPTVSWTAENGAVSTGRPTEEYYFDVSGRLIATKDANGNVNKRALLAHTGHGGSEAVETAQFRADNTTAYVAYDVFGDARKFTDGLGAVSTREYDKAGRLTVLTHEARPAGTIGNGGSSAAALTESFAYDGLGRRIQQWNSQLGSTVKETTDYDLEGRVSKTTTFGGHSTLYAYAWSGTLATTGLGTFGGWVKTTTHVSGRTASESQDYFGRTVARTNLGGWSHNYGFDKAGRVTQLSTTMGVGLIAYSYFSSGLLKSVTDSQAGTAANYVYDAAGNRTYEDYTVTVTTSVYEHEIGWIHTTGTEPRQASSATYDALNRLLSAGDTVNGVSVAYEYDLNGNVRRVEADYADPLGGSTPKEQVLWYRYDAMNRFVTAKGLLSGARGSGTIVRGEQGADLTYDAAGNRKTATTSRTVTEDVLVPYYDGVEYYEVSQSRTYLKTRIETYDYTKDGFLEQVSIAETEYDGATSTTAMGSSVVRAKDARDLMGRVTAHTEYLADGTTVAYSRTATYNADSLVTTDTVNTRQANGTTKKAVNTYLYTEYVSGAQSSAASYSGAYTGGAVAGTITANYKISTSGSQSNEPATSQRTTFTWMDDARQLSLHHQTGSATPMQTTFTYTAGGRLASAFVGDGTQRTVTYDTDPTGQVMRRTETSNAMGGTPTDKYHYIGGIKYGETSNNGTAEVGDYASAINQRSTTVATSNLYRYGSAKAHADFDQAYDPITPGGTRGTASTYVVHDGDTLQSIATAAWGDASLWWMIAEANGLTSADAITGGMTLEIPNRVSNFHNTDDTFRPYDPNKAIGDLTPNVPKPPRQKNNCGVIGVILMVVIAVVVTVATWNTLGPMAATKVGQVFAAAASAAAGSTVSQVAGIAMGVQEDFSWNAVALAAITAGVTKGLGQFSSVDKFFKGLSNSAAVQNAARAGVASIISQGVGKALGLQKEFSWAGVAVAAVGAGVSTGVSAALDGFDLPGWADNAIGNVAGGVAGAAAQSLVEGSDFGDNLVSALPGIIGNTIGGMIADKMSAPPKPRFGQLAQGDSEIDSTYDRSVTIEGEDGPVRLTINQNPDDLDVVNIVMEDYRNGDGIAPHIKVTNALEGTDMKPVALHPGSSRDYDYAPDGGTGVAYFMPGASDPINGTYFSYNELIGRYANDYGDITHVSQAVINAAAASFDSVNVANYVEHVPSTPSPSYELDTSVTGYQLSTFGGGLSGQGDNAWVSQSIAASTFDRLKSQGPARYDPHAPFVENGVTYQWRDTGNAMRKERVQLAGVYDPEADAARRRNMEMIGFSAISPYAAIRGDVGIVLGEDEASRHQGMVQWAGVEAVVTGVAGARLYPRPTLLGPKPPVRGPETGKPQSGIRANQLAGTSREALVRAELSMKYPGANIQNEVYLRTADGKRAIDPLSSEARRIDFVVTQNGKILDSVEATSVSAKKASQIAKEMRIRQSGGHFIRDRDTGQLLDIREVPTRIIRKN